MKVRTAWAVRACYRRGVARRREAGRGARRFVGVGAVGLVLASSMVVGVAAPANAFQGGSIVKNAIAAGEIAGPEGEIAAGVVIGGYYLWKYHHQILNFIANQWTGGSSTGHNTTGCGSLKWVVYPDPASGPAVPSARFQLGYSGPSTGCMKFPLSSDPAMQTFGDFQYQCRDYASGQITTSGYYASYGQRYGSNWSLADGKGPSIIGSDLCGINGNLVQLMAEDNWDGHTQSNAIWSVAVPAGGTRTATVHLDCKSASGATATLDYQTNYVVGAGNQGSVDIHSCDSILPGSTIVGEKVLDGTDPNKNWAQPLYNWTPTNLPTDPTDPAFKCWYPVDEAHMCFLHVQTQDAAGNWIECASGVAGCDNVAQREAAAPLKYLLLWGGAYEPWSSYNLGPDPYPATGATPSSAPAVMQTTAVAANGNSLTFTLGSAPAAGDVMVLGLNVSQYQGARSETVPAGWTAVDSATAGSDTLRLYLRTAGTAEPSSFTVSISGGVENNSGGLTVLRGVSATGFQEVISSSGTPSLTTGAAGLAVAMFTQDLNNPGWTVGPTGWSTDAAGQDQYHPFLSGHLGAASGVLLAPVASSGTDPRLGLVILLPTITPTPAPTTAPTSAPTSGPTPAVTGTNPVITINDDGSTTTTYTNPDGSTAIRTQQILPDGRVQTSSQTFTPQGNPRGNVVVQIQGTPGTGTTVDPGTDGSSCGGEWSWNPVDWVLNPVKCALRWAFVPDAAHTSQVTSLTDGLLTKVPFGPVSQGITWLGGLVPGGSSCWVQSVTIPQVATFTAIDTCTPGPVEAQVMALRGLLTAAMFASLFIPLAWWGWKTYAPGATGSG